MSEMASWFETKDKGYIFLTDDDVVAFHENKGESTRNIDWCDFVGHNGLMHVFSLPDRYVHHEGFVRMPDVIRKAIFDGKMDKLFAHAGNLSEATPEFIPLMRRLANRYDDVKSQLEDNPYADEKFQRNPKRKLTVLKQMEIGVRRNFPGSTIGELLRHPDSDEKVMMVALMGAQDYMNQHSDRHHYRNIIDHRNVTKKVLKFILKNIDHDDIHEWAAFRLGRLKNGTPKRVMSHVKHLRIKTINRGNAKIRMAV